VKGRNSIVGVVVCAMALMGASPAFAHHHHHKKKHHHHGSSPTKPSNPLNITPGGPCTYAEYSSSTAEYVGQKEFICQLKKSPGCSPATEQESPGPCSYFWEQVNVGVGEGAWVRLP
jgi:hypothetical protein